MLLRADSPWLAAIAVTAIYAGVSWSLGPPDKPTAPASTPRPAAPPPAERMTAGASSPQPEPPPSEAQTGAAEQLGSR